jgi:phosphoribosylanthranilate isomerase
MSVAVKICGIRDETALRAAVEGGAKYAGFVFVPDVRRYVEPEKAAQLVKLIPEGVQAVGLFQDLDDATLLSVLKLVPLKIIQLHGHETPERVAEVRVLTRLKIVKAVHVATVADLDGAAAYEAVADMLLFDTKLGMLPTGGTGKSFDWSLLKGKTFAKPWMLAGGINTGNLAEAVAMTGARIVDVSSGVEDMAGHKDPDKIRALLAMAARV